MRSGNTLLLLLCLPSTIDEEIEVATTTRQFYGPGSDLHYSEARYFCMYLQENGLLEKYYKKFRGNYDKDKTGRKFLEELLGKKLDEIQKDWLKWVKTLKYER